MKRRETPDQRADRYIDIYLSGITSISNDAGWNGESMMSLMITFHGQIPHGQRNDQADLTMINAIDKLREKHAEFDRTRKTVQQMLGSFKDEPKIKAWLAKRYYQGLNPKTGKPYNNSDRLIAINQHPIIETPEEAETKWNTALKYYERRVREAREIFKEKMGIREEAA